MDAVGCREECGYVDPYQVLADLCTSGAGAAPRAALERWLRDIPSQFMHRQWWWTLVNVGGDLA